MATAENQASSTDEHKLIRELTMRSDIVSMIARVWRKWLVYGRANPAQTSVVCFLLIDAEGSKIQASVMMKSEHERFINDVEPGKVYEFDNFGVSENEHPFRATAYKFKITFGPQTSYYPEDADIPRNAYTFMNISDILALPSEKEIDYLIDVIGFVKAMGQLEEPRTQSAARCWLRMVLQDAQENELECILFGDAASEAALTVENVEGTSLVVVLNLARLTWTDDKRRQIASSYGATQVLFNPKIPEVASLQNSIEERGTPLTTQFNQSMPSQRNRSSVGESLQSEAVTTLDNIVTLKEGAEVVIRVELGKLESHLGWNYDGCPKCASKPKHTDPQDPNSPLFCTICKKNVPKLQKKMRLTYLVSDETGVASVTFWDKQATQFMNKSLDQLKLTLEPKKRLTGIPKELDMQMGKRLLLRIRISKYNKDNPGSALTVSEFTICEDLMEQFNAATSEFQSETTAKSGNKAAKHNKETSFSTANTASSQSIDLTQENCTVNLDDDTPLAQAKGKRRSASTLRGDKGVDSPGVTSGSAVRPDGRLLKTIKQEKC